MYNLVVPRKLDFRILLLLLLRVWLTESINKTRNVYWAALVNWWQFFKYRWSNRWLSIALILSQSSTIDSTAQKLYERCSYNELPPGWFSCFVYLLPLPAAAFILFVSYRSLVCVFWLLRFGVWSFNSLFNILHPKNGQISIIKLVWFGFVSFDSLGNVTKVKK